MKRVLVVLSTAIAVAGCHITVVPGPTPIAVADSVAADSVPRVQTPGVLVTGSETADSAARPIHRRRWSRRNHGGGRTAPPAAVAEGRSTSLPPGQVKKYAERNEPPARAGKAQPRKEPPAQAGKAQPRKEPPARARKAQQRKEPPAQARKAQPRKEPPAQARKAQPRKEPPAQARKAQPRKEPPARAQKAQQRKEPPARARNQAADDRGRSVRDQGRDQPKQGRAQGGKGQKQSGSQHAPSAASPSVATVAQLLGSDALVGKKVQVTGVCLAKTNESAAGEAPGKGAWQLGAHGGAIWVVGARPGGCTAKGRSAAPVTIVAKVAQDHSSSRGRKAGKVRRYLVIK